MNYKKVSENYVRMEMCEMWNTGFEKDQFQATGGNLKLEQMQE